MSPRPPPKISLKYEWKRELGSEHAQQSEVGQLSWSFQSNQPILNLTRERTGRPVVTHDVINVSDSPPKLFAHESETFNVGDETHYERTVRPVIDHDVSHESIMVKEADMDFRIPGLPHSVVKHAQSTRVREVIQKIENHPDRHALQQDLRQNQSFNPFSPESKQMIQDVGNIELCELFETEPKTHCFACLSYWNIGIVYCTCGHFFQKETAVHRKFVKFTMDLLQLPEYVIKKWRPHGHRKGEKPWNKEYYLGNQLKKKCKKRQFQGIHDRFLQDQEFRVRMIEHNRDEEVCRRWDALADEDHTHHLTAQEYFHYKNKWWLHSNKQGSNIMPLRHRSDFKQALSTLQRLQQETGEEPHVPPYSYKHKQSELAQSSSSTWWNWQGSWWSSYNSESQGGGELSLEWSGRPVSCSIWQESSIWLQMKLTITEYSLSTSAQVDYKNPEGKNSTFGIAFAWWHRARHQWQRDHQDPEHLPHSAHEHWHVSAQFSCLLVRFLSSWFTHCTWLKFHLCASSHGHPCTQWACLFDLESSTPFYFLIFSFILNLLHFLLHFFHYLEGSSNTAYFAWKEMDSLDDSYLFTLASDASFRRLRETTLNASHMKGGMGSPFMWESRMSTSWRRPSLDPDNGFIGIADDIQFRSSGWIFSTRHVEDDQKLSFMTYPFVVVRRQNPGDDMVTSGDHTRSLLWRKWGRDLSHT